MTIKASTVVIIGGVFQKISLIIYDIFSTDSYTTKRYPYIFFRSFDCIWGILEKILILF